MTNFEARYSHLSHAELYRQLAGDSALPYQQVDKVEQAQAEWRQLAATASGLAQELARELNKLQASWDSDGGREYHRRVGIVATYADDLNYEFTVVANYLKRWAEARREALSGSEPPPNPTHARDEATKAGFVGGAIVPVAAPVTAAIGYLHGVQMDNEEKAKAKERMLKVVARLAERYATSSSGWAVPQPPPDLPSDARTGIDSNATWQQGGRTTTGFASSSTYVGGGSTVQASSGSPGTASASPDLGAGGDTPPAQTGGLLSADTAPLTAATTTSTIGLTASVRGAVGSTPIGGTAGAFGPPIPSSTGSLTAQPPGDRPATGLRAGNTGRHGGAGNAAGTGRRTGEHDPNDERYTWLTEDDMVWGDDLNVAPPVLGARQHQTEEPHPALNHDERVPNGKP